MHIRDRIIETRKVPAKSLRPSPLNWRTHPSEQRDAFRGVLAEIGVAGVPVARLCDDGGLELIDGHLRAEELQDQDILVAITDLSRDEAKKLLAVYDPIGDMAGVDEARLAELHKEIEFDSPALMQMLNELSEKHLADGDGQNPEPGGGGDEFDATPEEQGTTRTASGDLWLIGGKHKLLVGDCTIEENVKRLMGEDRATCVFTDPPYGVSIGAKNRLLNSIQPFGRCLTDIEDDEISPDDLKARLLPAFVNYRTLAMAEDCTIMVCSPQGGELGMMMMMMMMKEAGLLPRHILIWKKNAPTFSMGRLDYDYQHEPIIMTWGKRHKKKQEGKHRTSVWEVDKPRSSADHPTMKPVELYENAYLNHTDTGDIVADFYGGSGTSIIAAHRTNRIARLCEIEPRYADVILKRAEAEGMAVEKIE